MMLTDELKSTACNDRMFVIKYAMACFFVFFLGFMFLKYPLNTAEGIKRGINLSVDTLVPTLFPFLVISELIINTGICSRISMFAHKITSVLFAQPWQALTVYLLSISGGYPVGPSIVKKLYENKQISREQAQRMLAYCMSPGPAFVISTVGYGMLNSQKIGIVLYLSVVTASFVLAVLTRFLKKEDFDESERIVKPQVENNFSQAFVESIDRSTKSMISVCAWVVFFCCVMELVNVIIKSNDVKNIVLCVCEVTTACNFLAGKAPLQMMAALISFGGFAVHFQVMSCIVKVKMKIKYFFAARIVHASFSCIICHLILKIVPESVKVVSMGVKPSSVNIGNGMSLSFALFILSCLIMLGDNLVIRIKSRKI